MIGTCIKDGDLPKGWQNALEVCRQGELVMEYEKELALVPLYAIYDDLLTERVGATVEPIFQDGQFLFFFYFMNFYYAFFKPRKSA